MLLVVFCASIGFEPAARACGCFTLPDPTVPVVQAGEQIAFAMDNGQVTANIQIQYSGPAADFGWLLPLPSVPTLELGTDELFAKLQQTTRPQYDLTRIYEGNCQYYEYGATDLGAFAAADGGAAPGFAAPASPLVYQDSIGPYDYAVLHADTKDPMLAWLAANHYFVPDGTAAAVGPYIHTGAYFLALKLKSGQSAGDLQPVVVHYQADLPMIPIILTSVGATPDMDIIVWILGDGRAIPRNYYHTVLNDALINWEGAANYKSVVTQAVSEAPQKHSFVTEYAGSSGVMKNRLNYPGRFGTVADLAASANIDSFLEYLRDHDYPYTVQLLAILEKYLPVPTPLAQRGITPGQFYFNITLFRLQNPSDFVGWAPNFQPAEMAMEIDQRVVQPTVNASAMFDAHPYLTRLYTTLSPEDMTADPVFSFNASLPDVSNVHKATLTYHCGTKGLAYNTPATLVTESGWTVEYPNGFYSPPSSANMPAAARTEVLGDNGPPQVITQHDPPQPTLARGGCGVADPTHAAGGALGALLVGVAIVVLRRRERACGR
jgi:hypothetical protein